MAKQIKESKLKKRVDELLNAHGCYYLNPMTYGRGESGHPDKIASHHGHLLAIELKTNKGKLTALQQYQLHRAYLSGASVAIINEDNIYELDELLLVITSEAVEQRRSPARIINPYPINLTLIHETNIHEQRPKEV